MRRLLAELGNPERRFPVAHVAGTKGKGSTVAMLAEILHEAGYTVGRYMSPHVHRIEERIWVGGRLITAADFVAACEQVIPTVEHLDLGYRHRGLRGPTWFEVVTAAAFIHFARARVDIAVLETGLGGRLDATTVSHPLVSVITSISLDHMALLGDTVAAIAGEKAGIIKRGCPVVCGALHPDARRVIATVAARRRAPLLQLGRDFRVAESAAEGPARGSVEIVVPDAEAPTARRRYELAMIGRHQADNAALAIIAADVLARRDFPAPPAALARGLARVRLPARIERVAERPLVICDAAHNVASMQSLLETVAPLLESRRHRALVFAASADKQIEEMLACARGRFDHVIVTRYLRNPRACDTERLKEACVKVGLPQPRVADSPEEALRIARSRVGREGVVVVAGSFFLAGEIAAALRSHR
jgi:dihydrofolate synthase/folylpolyglutamate synthase